jgi:hydroxyacylglutathione hydrolase
MIFEKRSKLGVAVVPVLEDNYVFVLEDLTSGARAVVDPGEAGPVLETLDGRPLDLILITHHHFDHVGGNVAVKEQTGAHIIGPAAESDCIPAMDEGVRDGDTITLGEHIGKVIEVPGHSSGHIAFWFEEAGLLFCGDTIFHLGCGRLSGGTPTQMWRSLNKLRALPPETLIYFAHEYSASNCRFALTVEPDNAALKQQAGEIERKRSAGLPTVPSTLAVELAANPFLRVDQTSVRARLAAEDASPTETFAKLRRLKDEFR